MKTINAIVEKINTGFSAYIDYNGAVAASTVGDSMDELKEGLNESLALFIEVCDEDEIDVSELKDVNIELKLDVKQLFKEYNTLNVSGFAVYAGINRSLLGQYVIGLKNPSEKQSRKIIDNIEKLGKEYLSMA